MIYEVQIQALAGPWVDQLTPGPVADDLPAGYVAVPVRPDGVVSEVIPRSLPARLRRADRLASPSRPSLDLLSTPSQSKLKSNTHPSVPVEPAVALAANVTAAAARTLRAEQA